MASLRRTATENFANTDFSKRRAPSEEPEPPKPKTPEVPAETDEPLQPAARDSPPKAEAAVELPGPAAEEARDEAPPSATSEEPRISPRPLYSPLAGIAQQLGLESGQTFTDRAVDGMFEERKKQSRANSPVGGREEDDLKPLPEPAELLHERGDFMWERACESFEAAQFEVAEELFKRSAQLHRNGGGLHGEPRPKAGECVDQLAAAYRKQGLHRQAEMLYLQMLLWHEATQHFKAENFAAANTLFSFGSYFATVQEAQAFLETLSEQPGIGVHKVEPCLVLLCCDADLARRAMTMILRLLTTKEPAAGADPVDALIQAGAAELIFTCGQTHEEDPELVAPALQALRLLLPLEHPDRPRMVFWLRQHGGVSWIIGRLRHHAGHAGVQKQGCLGLASLAHEDMALQTEMLESHTVQLALGLPEKFAAAGPGAVQILSTLLSAPTWTHPRVELSREDALRYFLRGMHKQPENVSVAMAGLQMLRLFGASWPQLLVEEHAVHAILTALQLEGTKTAALANEVLWALTAESETVCTEFAARNGVQLLAASMDQHAAHVQVQLPAIGVVRNIACNHEGRKSSLVRTNFVERLLTTMKRYPADYAITEAGLGAMKNLIASAPFALVRCRGLQSVMGILSRPGLPDAAWVQGLHLLRIYTEHPELLKELHCAGAAEQLKACRVPQNGASWELYAELLRAITEK